MKKEFTEKPLSWLHPHPRNPRLHPEGSISAIVNSIERFGFLNPIIALPDGTIIAGEGRYRASQQKGLEKVPVLVVDMTEEEALSYMVVDNATTELSDWDLAGVAQLLEELEQTEFDLGGISVPMTEALLGFSPSEDAASVKGAAESEPEDDLVTIKVRCPWTRRERSLPC